MFQFGKSLINMNSDEQKSMLDNLAPGHRKGAYEMGIGFNKPDPKQQQRQKKRDAYHDLDRLNHIVETENDAHDLFTKGLNGWQRGVTGKKLSKDATGLKKQFDDYEQTTLSQFPSGGKRHKALSESLPKIKDTFLKQGSKFAVGKLNERSRSVLDKGLQRIANGALGAKTNDDIKVHDDAAFDLINKYVLSVAKFDENDADTMYDRYLSYAGVESKDMEGSDSTAPDTPGKQTMEYNYERDGGDHRETLPHKNGENTKKEMFAAATSEDQADLGDEEQDGTNTKKSSVQHARDMEKKAEKENESGKLAGADNDTHYNKQAGADKTYESKKWTPERVDFARTYVGSKAYSKEAEIDQFEKGDYKCNKFVNDVLIKSGADVPQVGGLLEGDPPSAANWANQNLEIEGYEIVETPRPGDVAAFDKHVGIVTEDGKTISASSKTNTVVENDWGFRPHQKGKVTFRRYVGKRKK